MDRDYEEQENTKYEDEKLEIPLLQEITNQSDIDFNDNQLLESMRAAAIKAVKKYLYATIHCHNIDECTDEILNIAWQKFLTHQFTEPVRNPIAYFVEIAVNCAKSYTPKCSYCNYDFREHNDEFAASFCLTVPQLLKQLETNDSLRKFMQLLSEEDCYWIMLFAQERPNHKAMLNWLRKVTPDLTEEAYRQRKSRKQKRLSEDYDAFLRDK